MTPDLRKRGRAEPVAIWTSRKVYGVDDAFHCIDSSAGRAFGCGIWHRTEGAAKRHCEQLNRKEARRSA